MPRSQQDWINNYIILLEEYLQQGTYSPAIADWLEQAIAAQIPLSTLPHWHHQSLEWFLKSNRAEQDLGTLLHQVANFQAYIFRCWNQSLEDRRGQFENNLHQRIEFEHLIGSLSSQLMELTGRELDRGIEETVRDLAQFNQCDRAYLFEFSSDRSAAVLRCQWHCPEFGPLPSLWHQMPVEFIPWWMEKLQKNQIIIINSAEDFPPEAKAEQAIVSALQAQSLLLLPLMEGSWLMGYLGFSTVQTCKIWPRAEIRQLQWTSKLLANTLKRQRVELALEHLNQEIEFYIDRRTIELQQVNHQLEAEILERQQIEQALRESEARFRPIFEDSPLGIAIINCDYGLERVNASLCQMLGYTTVDCQSLTLLDWWHPEDRELGEKLLQRLIKGDLPSFQVKQRFVHQRQEILWVKLIASVISSPRLLRRFSQISQPISQPSYGMVIIEDITKKQQAEETLQLIQFTLNRVMDSVLLIDANGQLIYVNDRACQTLDYSREQLSQMQIEEIDRSCSDRIWPIYWQQVKKQGFIRIDSVYQTQWGEKIPVEINLNFFQYKGLEYGCAIARDLRDRQQVELALRENETRYRTLVSHIPGAIYRCLIDLNWTVEFISDAIEAIAAYSASELMSNKVKGLVALIHPEDLPRIREEIATAVTKHHPFELEYRMIARDGTIRWVYEKGQGVWNQQQELVYLDGAIFDVSDRKQAEEQLKGSLAEKDVLLREIHHRVKNNLNIIYSLLDMQSRQVSDPDLNILLEDSQKRLKTMALIHEKLYCSKSLSRIDFAEYIRSLASNIWASYGMHVDRINLAIEADPVELNIETAIPTGLIINELVTNALKHGFPDRQEGTIWIKFHETNTRQLDLKVVDNGVGLPSDGCWQQSSSLGMRLVHILAEQLDACLEVHQEDGTCFHLVFEPRS